MVVLARKRLKKTKQGRTKRWVITRWVITNSIHEELSNLISRFDEFSEKYIL